MRSLGRIAVIILLLVFSDHARAAGAVAGAGTSDEQQLRQLTVEWMAAVAKKDARRLEQIMAPDYTLEMPGVLERVGRAEWVRNAINKQWGNFRYENVSVAVEGGQAVVTSRLYFKVSPIPATLDSGIVDVWTKRSGQWQIKTRYLATSDFFTKVTFAAGVIATAVLLAVAAVVLRFVRRRRTNLRSA